MGIYLTNRLAPPGLHRLGGAFALGVAVLLVGACSQVQPVDPLRSSAAGTSCSAATSATAPAELVPGLTQDVHSDETSHVHLATPVIPGAGLLTERLRAMAASDLSGYSRDLAASGGEGGELNLSWHLTGVSPRAVGVQLDLRRSVDAKTTVSTQVTWWDRVDHRLLGRQDLFTSTGWSEFTSRLTTDPCAGGPTRQPLVAQALSKKPGKSRLAISFAADGSAVVTVSSIAAGSEPFSVVLGAADVGAWLSPTGQAAWAASVRPESLPPVQAGAETPAPKQKTDPGKSATPKAVDCRKARCVALTFDDGPGPYTDDLVRHLQQAKAPATFFMMGEQVKAFPDVAKTVARGGFEIGNHSYSHPDLTRLSKAQLAAQLSKTSNAIHRATGQTPTLMRPPYGARNAAVDKAAARAGLTEVLWDVDTLDWKHRNAKVVRRDALAGTRRGSIVLMHDIHPTTVRAVPSLVTELRKRGYTLVTVSELLGPTRPGSRHFRAN